MAPKKDQVPGPTPGAQPVDPNNPDNGETAGAGVTKKKPPQQPTDDPAKKPVQVEQFGRMVIDPTKLASDEELAKLPRTNLWTELTTGDPNAKPPKLPRINADDATKLHPGTKTFLQSLDCVHYPGDSGMLAIYDKTSTGVYKDKPILDLTAGNIVSIHREGDINDPTYQKSAEHTAAVLKGAVLAKMTNQPPGTSKTQATVVIDTPATESGGKPSLSKLIMAYAAEKTGLHAVGSDGNRIDTSALPPEVRTQMDTQWDKMKGDYGFKSPTEAFNPVANPPPNGASPAAKIDPKQPLSDKQIADNAIAKASQRWANSDVKFDDRASVYTHLLDWAGKLDTGKNTPEAKAANHLHTALASGGGNMDSAAIVKAVTDYQTELKNGGVKADAGGGTVEDISMTTQAFAAKNNIAGVDTKLYHQYQPSDGLTNEQVGITTTAPAVVPPPTPGAAPKQ